MQLVMTQRIDLLIINCCDDVRAAATVPAAGTDVQQVTNAGVGAAAALGRAANAVLAARTAIAGTALAGVVVAATGAGAAAAGQSAGAGAVAADGGQRAPAQKDS